MFRTPHDRLRDLLALESSRALDGPELRELLRELATMAFDHPTSAGAVSDIFWPAKWRGDSSPDARCL